jgi:quercetin dioxygenase-like cupin family protein
MSNYLIAPNDGKLVWLGPPQESMGVHFKLFGEQTAGAFSIVEHPIAPRTLVPPHTHTHEDEFSFVLEGKIGARIGDDVLEEATPGCYIIKPRGIPHSFWNPSSKPARIIEIISPPGFERYFAEGADLLTDGPPDMDAIAKLAARYGLTFHMEWVPDLVAKYNLNWLRSET